MMTPTRIRNFSIIAHIDHGKSTLADRLLEATGTIPERKMREQVLDSMELERERGITIKMQPVRMLMKHEGTDYVLNLIDTPGHIDFSYEVSRALKAVEGTLLLVDATQGVQAQTLTTLAMARELGLTIIPVVSKIDSPLARIDDVKAEMVKLLECSPDDVCLVSGRTGEGVPELLNQIIKRIPAPHASETASVVAAIATGPRTSRSLIFDFQYSNHRGVIVYVRVLDGSITAGDQLTFIAADETCVAGEVGVFTPEQLAAPSLSVGEIGYIVTGVKEPGIASVGDTITHTRAPLAAVAGYLQPLPVVWASVYPESQDDLNTLRMALGKLKLTDASLSFEEESSGTLGRGFRCGFLGMLHLEIVTERLRREFDLILVVTTPSITYHITDTHGVKSIIYSAVLFPLDQDIRDVQEPWVRVTIICPTTYLNNIMPLVFDHEGQVYGAETFGEGRTRTEIDMPLRELMRNFFDAVKSASSGFASVSYELIDMHEANVTRLDIYVAEEMVPAFSRVIPKLKAQAEGEKAVEKLYQHLPRQMFATKIQALAHGRILSSRTLPAMQKNVTQHMYGGDITRKRKLWEKQKRGKKRMKAEGTVNIPHDVFLKMIKEA